MGFVLAVFPLKYGFIIVQVIAILCCHNLDIGSVSPPQALYFTIQQLGCMRFLEYMGFELAVFPLKYGFIIVQMTLYVLACIIHHRVCFSCIWQLVN